MDFLKNAAGQFSGSSQGQAAQGHGIAGTTQQQSLKPDAEQKASSGGIGGFFSGLGEKANSAAGGGRESEEDEDYLDKGIDYIQEKFLGQGPQDNESAVEQAKDEQISDFIRGKYKSTTGKDFFVADKPTKLDPTVD